MFLIAVLTFSSLLPSPWNWSALPAAVITAIIQIITKTKADKKLLLAKAEVEAFRLELKNRQFEALTPVIEAIALANQIDGKPTAHAKLQKSLDYVLAGAKTLLEKETLRITIFKLVRVQKRKPQLQVLQYHGRGKNPPRAMISGDSGRGDSGVELALSRSHLIIEDTSSSELPSGVEPSSSYTSFISVSIHTGELVHGLLSVDCAEPEKLTAADLSNVQLLAEISALIFATGARMGLHEFVKNKKP